MNPNTSNTFIPFSSSSSSSLPSSSSSSSSAVADPSPTLIDPTQLLVSSLLPSFTGGANGPNGPTATAHGVRTRTFRTKFLPEHVYEYYAKQTALTLQSLPPNHLRYRELPLEFIDIMPLDKAIKEEAVQNTLNSIASSSSTTTGTYGYVTTVYKAISTDDGFAYAVRRIEGARSTVGMMDNVVNSWARVSHPSIVSLRRAFSGNNVRNSVGIMNSSNTLFFVYDYYPGAQTLKEYFFDHGITNTPTPAITGTKHLPSSRLNHQGLIPEHLLWSYACQIICGLRTVHEGGVNFRGLRLEHILITGRGRIRISGAGITDILEADSVKHAETGRLLDMQSVGSILLQLATRSLAVTANPNTMTTGMDTVQRTYSVAFHAFLVVLLTKTPTADMACRLLTPQLVTELDTLYDHSDGLDALLHREADNGRLLRLLLKLGFINERPEYEGDAAWAETGDRYILKLFRDFLFHQTTDDGRPVLNVAHIIDSLNRLDMGSASKILLSSRDGASLLVSSYGEVRSAVNHAFEELRQAALRKDSSTGGINGSNYPSSSSSSGPNASGGEGNNGENDNEWFRRPRIPAVVRARSFNGNGSTIGGRNGNRANLGIRGMLNAANNGLVSGGGGNNGFNPLGLAAATMGMPVVNPFAMNNPNAVVGGGGAPNPFSMLQGFATMGMNNGNNNGTMLGGSTDGGNGYDYNGNGGNDGNGNYQEYVPNSSLQPGEYYDDSNNGGYGTNSNEYHPPNNYETNNYGNSTTIDGGNTYYSSTNTNEYGNNGSTTAGNNYSSQAQEYYPPNNNNNANTSNYGGNNNNNSNTFNVGAREFRPNW